MNGWLNLELAWAAGFFEGEGCVSLQKKWRRLTLSAAQAGSPYTLDRLAAAVGHGNVTGPKRSRPAGQLKPVYTWSTSGLKAHKVMDLLIPYLSKDCVKKERYYRLIEEGCIR